MAPSLQDLREQRFAKASQVKTILDSPKFTKQNEAEVDALYAEINSIDGRIHGLEKHLILSNDLEGFAHDLSARHGGLVDQSAHKVNAASKAFVNALRFGAERLSPEERALISADAPGNRGRVQNVAEGTGATGGYLVPTILMPNVLVKMKAFGGMRTVAKLFSTSSGSPIAWATMDDTASVGELVGENVAASTGDASFGQVITSPSKFSSKIVPVSFEVLQDASADVKSVVLDALAIRLARAQNFYFTLGTGISQPQGVVTAASLGYTMPSGNMTSVTYDGLINLYHAVDPAYRASPSCAFMMNDQAWKVVKLIKDNSNRPLWLPATGGAFPGNQQPDTLLGKPLVINQDMANMAASAKSIIFGDFSQYMIRDVMDVLILRFTDSAYAGKGQIGFMGWARADGRLISASTSAIVYLQNSAT